MTLRSFKTCYSFWKKAQKIYANDIQRLYDAVDKLTSLKQIDHEMTLFVVQFQSTVEELRMFLDAESVEEMKRKHDNLYMVLALRAMNPDFDHICDQVLTNQEVPSMESLLTRLLRVPNSRKNENSLELIESSTMVSSRRRGGRGNRGCGGRSGGRNGQLYCTHCKIRGHTQDSCYDIVGWPEKTANVSTSKTHEPKFSEEEYQKYL